MEQVIITKDNMGLFDIRPLIRLFSTMRAGQYMVEVKRHRGKRTDPQNRYYWGLVVPAVRAGLIAIGWEDMTNDELVHEYLKEKFGKTEHVNKHTGEVVCLPTSTAEMNTLEFTEYIEQVREWAAKDLYVTIPDPNTTIK